MEVKTAEKELNLIEAYNRNVPSIMKYMGSKKSIIDFVIEGINEVYDGGVICDLFAGTSILSGALGKTVPIHSNDIQEYSALFAKTYLSNYDWSKAPSVDEIIAEANLNFTKIIDENPELVFDYSKELTLDEFNELELRQQNLKKNNFENVDYHLFIKYYSGTYWSYYQCAWIDSIRKVADKHKNTPLYNVILSSLIFAMSYCSQSTGHVAQYRDATDESSKNDILIYRRKRIEPFFIKKLDELINFLGRNTFNHKITTLDYEKCLDEINSNYTVYADPPYCFVHYSRFYHAFETLVKYDYPEIKFKGRYRTDRHQSPFCQRSQVKNAFTTMFQKINSKGAQLVLSYCNTGMISLEEINNIAKQCFDQRYQISNKGMEYKHSTMGRSDEKNKDVEEYLIIIKRIQNV